MRERRQFLLENDQESHRADGQRRDHQGFVGWLKVTAAWIRALWALCQTVWRLLGRFRRPIAAGGPAWVATGRTLPLSRNDLQKRGGRGEGGGGRRVGRVNTFSKLYRSNLYCEHMIRFYWCISNIRIMLHETKEKKLRHRVAKKTKAHFSNVCKLAGQSDVKL